MLWLSVMQEHVRFWTSVVLHNSKYFVAMHKIFNWFGVWQDQWNKLSSHLNATEASRNVCNTMWDVDIKENKKVNFFCYDWVKPVLIFVWEGTHSSACGCFNVFSRMPINMTMEITCCTNRLPLMILCDVWFNNTSSARISVMYPIFKLESYRLFTGLYIF